MPFDISLACFAHRGTFVIGIHFRRPTRKWCNGTQHLWIQISRSIFWIMTLVVPLLYVALYNVYSKCYQVSLSLLVVWFIKICRIISPLIVDNWWWGLFATLMTTQQRSLFPSLSLPHTLSRFAVVKQYSIFQSPGQHQYSSWLRVSASPADTRTGRTRTGRTHTGRTHTQVGHTQVGHTHR